MIDPTELFQRQWEDQDPMVAHINRQHDEIVALRGIIQDLILGARRDRSLLIRSRGPEHVIETRVTKGQVLRAIEAIRPTPGDTNG